MIGSKPTVFTKAFVSPSRSDTMQIDDRHYPYSSKVVNLVKDHNKSIGIILDQKKKKVKENKRGHKVMILDIKMHTHDMCMRT